jgi:hypothetical protein
MSTENITETTPAQARLAAARAELAEQQARLAGADEADHETVVRLPVPGDQVHFLVAGRTIPTALPNEWIGPGNIITTRAQTITITSRLIEAATDRFGGPGWVRFIHDEAGQLAQYGEVWVRAGAAPESLEPWTVGSPEWENAREVARRAAWAEADPERRAAARAAVQAKYGPASVTSTILNAAENPSIRQAREQQERLAARGVQHVNNASAREAGADR